MKLTCPECKNEVDMSAYPDLAEESVIECNICGISLMVKDMSGDKITVEVVDEGK